jgi:hypothetical protein
VELDSKIREAIEDILNRREGLRSLQAQIKEDIQAIAEVLLVKPAQVTRLISLVERERERGGILEAERTLLDAAQTLVPDEAQ